MLARAIKILLALIILGFMIDDAFPTSSPTRRILLCFLFVCAAFGCLFLLRRPDEGEAPRRRPRWPQ